MDQISKQLTDIQNRLTDIENRFKQHIHTGLDSQSLPGLPSGLASAPLASIPAPTGGATQDVVVRATVNTIIADMKTLGLTR